MNGKEYRIEGGQLVPVVKRGPLGGSIECLPDIKWKANTEFYLKCHILSSQPKNNYTAFAVETDQPGVTFKTLETDAPLFVETNIPPRQELTGEPMTAAEAARVPGIVGRWVAVRVDVEDAQKDYSLAIRAGKNSLEWLHYSAPVYLLPEGFGE